MQWAAVTWEDFERELAEYRDREYRNRSPISGENAYIEVVRELAGIPIADRGPHMDSVVLFLNRWNCHLPTKTDETRVALQRWLGREAVAVEALSNLPVTDPRLQDHSEELDRLHSSLVALKDVTIGAPRIPTMGVAAASKFLHVMVPSLFVMWDKTIKKNCGWSYGEFMLRMHGFAVHLRDNLAPVEARSDIDGYLQQALGYQVRKPLAKYIDEYNWWRAWGLGTARASAAT